MKQQRNNTWQRGAILIMTAFLLPLTIAMAGTAVDIGQAYLLKSKLQNATDAAAVAGAYELGNSKKVNTTVEDYLEKDTKYKGNLSYSDSEMPPNDENEAIYKTDQMSDELDVTMRANVKTAFVKLFGVDTIAVTALSKAKVEDEGDFTDEMFKYGLVAANKSPSDYNPQNRSDWTQGSTKTAILIDHNDVVINGDIRTNGKIALTNTEKSFNARVNGTIFASRDVKFEDSNEPGPNDYAVIVSLHGNIHIPINHLKLFRGILYAPNGKVVIDNMGDIEGNVIANQIEIKHNMTVSSKTMTSIGKSSRTGGRKVRLIN